MSVLRTRKEGHNDLHLIVALILSHLVVLS